MNNIVSQQLWLVLKLPNAFIPLVTKPNKTFQHS